LTGARPPHFARLGIAVAGDSRQPIRREANSEGRILMRIATLGVAAMLAASMVIPISSFAATKKGPIGHSLSYNECVALATERGFAWQDFTRDDSSERYMSFISQCMQGKLAASTSSTKTKPTVHTLRSHSECLALATQRGFAWQDFLRDD